MAAEQVKHWEKTSGPWPPQQVAAILTEFSYLERAAAHLRAGWIAKIPEMEVKIVLGQHLQQDLERSAQLLHRAQALGLGKGALVPAGFRTLLHSLEEAKGTLEFLHGLYSQTIAGSMPLYEKFVAETEPVADAASLDLVAGILVDKKSQLGWARVILANGDRPSDGFASRPEELWERRREGEGLAQDKWLWPPQDRVPRAVRPEDMRRGEAGAMRVLPMDPVAETGLFLHNFLNEEFTTLELIARNTYEHPEMPQAFHRDMARHAADEARHSQMFLDAARGYGVKYGDYPIYTFSYDGLYQFGPCPPGSKKELLWRVLIRQTINEGMALDSLAFEAKKREYLNQPHLARLFEFVLSDEIFHAASGLKWSRYLCQDDEDTLLRERAAAFGYYKDGLQKRRAQWVAEHPEGAVAEVEHLEEVIEGHQFPFKMTLNLAARKQAGFTEEEIHQFPELQEY